MNEQTTTLNKILKYSPCGQNGESEGFGKFMKYLNKTEPDDEPVTLLQILDSNGICDAIWAFRTVERQPWMSLYIADVAEHVLPLWEKKHPTDTRPRAAIDAIRKYVRGEISREELNAAYAAAYAAATAAATAAYAAAYATDAAAYAADAATAATAADAAYAAARKAERDWQAERLRFYLENQA